MLVSSNASSVFAYWKWLSTRYFSITMLPLVFFVGGNETCARKILSPSRGLAGQTKPRQKNMSTCSYLLFRASRASTLEHARTAAAPAASRQRYDADVRLHRIRHRVIAVVTHKLVYYCNTRYIYRLCLCIYDVLLLLILYMLSN